MADDPERSFLADMTGLFAQHSAMWSVYTESIKILVSVTSLPVLAAAVLISVNKTGDAAKSIDFAHLPQVISWSLTVVPVLDLFLLGVVIHHRLVILFYARALNGYRKTYLDGWNAARRGDGHAPIELSMPTDRSYPGNYEFWGPMGLIVHGSAVVNGLFIFGGIHSLSSQAWLAWICGLGTLLTYELWYRGNCASKSLPSPSPPATSGRPNAETATTPAGASSGS